MTYGKFGPTSQLYDGPMSDRMLLDRVVSLAKECVEQDRKIVDLQQENDVLKNIVKYLIDNRRIDDHA